MAERAFMLDDNQLRDYLHIANIFTLSNIRIVLDKIERYKNPVPVDLINIKYIMPQTQSDY